MSITIEPADFHADTPGMSALSRRAWEQFETACLTDRDVVPQAAGPVLFFGDLEAYRTSAVRVITVGLNPSLAEFPTSAPWRRFPGLTDPASYITSLSAYFRTDPYRAWFSSFEPILQGLGTSYYGGGTSTALHTDLLTAVPTDPTWSRLPHASRQRLGSPGKQLWRDLVEELTPQVVLISVAREHLQALELATPWHELHVIYRDNPFVVQAAELQLANHPLVVWGRAANTPFGTVSNIDKASIGQRILEVL